MEQVIALRPFLPAQDFALSKRFYQAIGFTLSGEDAEIAFLKIDSFSFILSTFYQKELAENLMMQMLVRNLDAFWVRVEQANLAAEFGVRPPRAPALQPWGMRVGFLVDPSGILWHIAEAKF
jgi:predicted lactoylglutathione lyase